MRSKSMRWKPWLGVMTAGVVGVLMMSQSARGSYDYSVATAPTTDVIGGTTITFTGNSHVGLNNTNTVSLASLAVASLTSPSTPDTINVPYTLTVTITDPSVTGTSQTFHVSGVLSGIAASDESDLQNTFTSVSPPVVTIGLHEYQLSVGTLGVPDIFYQPATVNGPPGGLGARITLTVIPEPASLGLITFAAAGLLIRRRRTA